MKPYGYFNGKIVKTDKAHIFLDDIGILRGFSAFDFFRIYNKKPFSLKDNYKRFQDSAGMLGLKVPITIKKLEIVLDELCKKNKVKNSHVRLILTGGKTKNGILPSKPNFYILFEEMQDLPDSLYKKGGKLILNDFQRLLPEAKTTNYMHTVNLQTAKQKAGAVEILYKDKGNILEGSTSNLFIVKKGLIVTPTENILHGITRKTVIGLAKKAGYKVKERNIKEKELFDADEVFITAANKKVLPIIKVDNKKIGNGKVGEISKELNEAYLDLINNL